MRKTKPIELDAAQKDRLTQFIGSGSAKAREIKHANVLLKLAQSWSYDQIASAFDLNVRTVIRIKQRFQKEGLETALVDKPRSGAPKKFEGELNVALTTLACSEAPPGHARWTLRLLSDRLVELDIVEAISHETVRERLKKTN